jgi:hypothetical protein
MDGESEMRLIISFLVTVLLTLSPAHAYVGPGLGAGSIAVVLGILASILLAIFAVVWYPLKRFFGSYKKNANNSNKIPDQDSTKD